MYEDTHYVFVMLGDAKILQIAYCGVLMASHKRMRRRRAAEIPCILESNPHPFYSFRGQKYQMQIRIACGLDLRSRAGFWKTVRAAVRAVRTIQ